MRINKENIARKRGKKARLRLAGELLSVKTGPIPSSPSAQADRLRALVSWVDQWADSLRPSPSVYDK
jgi:hypothetical protein